MARDIDAARRHHDRMSERGDSAYPCCVCGDPWTLEAADYVTLVVTARDAGTQSLGAHANCLNRFFVHRVEIAGDHDIRPSER
jgi:hypothetical protein